MRSGGKECEKWTAFEIDTFSERGVQAGKGIDRR